MADEATVVGVARGTWKARCLCCPWDYADACRAVDMAVKTHVSCTGHDANAWDSAGTLVLRLERDVLGRVVPRPDEPEPEATGRFTLNGAPYNRPAFDVDDT